MSGVRGIIAGTLGLTMLEAIVSNSKATANATGVIGFVSRGLARWFNPYTPLIPDLRTAAAAGGGPTTPGAPHKAPGNTPFLPPGAPTAPYQPPDGTIPGNPQKAPGNTPFLP